MALGKPWRSNSVAFKRVVLSQFVPQLFVTIVCWSWRDGKQDGDPWRIQGQVLLDCF